MKQRDARDLIVEELKEDPELRRIYFKDAMDIVLTGKEDIRVGLSMIRNIINAIGGFQPLADELNKSDKSLMMMLNEKRVPATDNFMKIVHYIIRKEHLTFDIKENAAA